MLPPPAHAAGGWRWRFASRTGTGSHRYRRRQQRWQRRPRGGGGGRVVYLQFESWGVAVCFILTAKKETVGAPKGRRTPFFEAHMEILFLGGDRAPPHYKRSTPFFPEALCQKHSLCICGACTNFKIGRRLVCEYLRDEWVKKISSLAMLAR